MTDRYAQSPSLALFWHWVRERHRIWYRRYVEKLPPPWTDDPYLGAHRFTNVYRRLDPGTAWLVDHVIQADASADEALLNVIAYRQGLHELSKAHLGWLTVDRTGLSNQGRAEEQMASFGPGTPYTGAYLLGNSIYRGPKRKTWPLLWRDIGASLAARRRDGTTDWTHLTRRELINLLRSFPGVGPFVSYQVCLDLSYPEMGLGLSHGNDGYALLGPGARKGLDLLPRPRLVAARQSGDDGYNARLVWLRDLQDEHLAGRMPGWDDGALDYVYLDRSDIENCCCEFGRYHEARRTRGHNLRRRFYPK